MSRQPFRWRTPANHSLSPGVLAGMGTAWTRRLNILRYVAVRTINNCFFGGRNAPSLDTLGRMGILSASLDRTPFSKENSHDSPTHFLVGGVVGDVCVDVVGGVRADGAWAAEDVFHAIPSDALAFVAVNRVAATSATVRKLRQAGWGSAR